MPLDPPQRENTTPKSNEFLKLGITLAFGLFLAILGGNLSLKFIGIVVPVLIPSNFTILFQDIVNNPNFIPVVFLCFCYSLYLILSGLWILINKLLPQRVPSLEIIPFSYKEKLSKPLDVIMLILIVLLGILYVLTNLETINIGLASPFGLFLLLIIFFSLDIFSESDISYRRSGNPAARWTKTINRWLNNYRRRFNRFLKDDFENEREFPFFIFFIACLLFIFEVHIFLVFFFIGMFVTLRLYFLNRKVPDQVYRFAVTFERGYSTNQFGSLKAGIVGIIVTSTLFFIVYSPDFTEPFTPFLNAFNQNWIIFCLILAITWISWAYKRFTVIFMGICMSLMVVSLDTISTVLLLSSAISLLLIGVFLRKYEIKELDRESLRLQEEITRIIQEKRRFKIEEIQKELGSPEGVDIKRVIHRVAPDIQKIHDYHKFPTFATSEWFNSFDKLLFEAVQIKGSIQMDDLAKELDVNLRWIRKYLDRNLEKVEGLFIIQTNKGSRILATSEWFESFENILLRMIKKEKAIKLANLAKELDVKIRWMRDFIEQDTRNIKKKIIMLNTSDLKNPIIVDRQLGPVIRINDLANILNVNPEVIKRDLEKATLKITIIKDSDLVILDEFLELDQELGDLARDIKRGNAIPVERLERSLGDFFDGIRFARHFAIEAGLVLTRIKSRFYLAEQCSSRCQLRNEGINAKSTSFQCKRCFKYLCQGCHNNLELTGMLNCPSCGSKDLQELPLICPQCLITVISVEDLEENLLCQLCGTSYQLITMPSTFSIKEYASLRQIGKIEKLLLKGELVPSRNEMSYISIRQTLRQRLHNKAQFLIQSNEYFKAQSLKETCQICQNKFENSLEFYYCTKCNRPVCLSCFSSKEICPYCSGSLIKYPKECIKCQVDYIHPNQLERENMCPFCHGNLLL
ncbi:MAG: hypothetical protein ACFFAE_10945 [Candidatus Hodarchaeota archaeon]